MASPLSWNFSAILLHRLKATPYLFTCSQSNVPSSGTRYTRRRLTTCHRTHLMDSRVHSVLREVEEHACELSADARRYWAEHKRRYTYLAQLLETLYSGADGGRPMPRRILDVGPSFQTLVVSRLFPDAHLATLGIEDARYKPSAQTRHLRYDLNDAFFRDSWPSDEPYDLILMLEVIEHLYASPWRVLGLLRSLTSPGGQVVVSTPNALFLRNRLALMRGKNPFEMLQDSRHRLGLGHYREYTTRELATAGERVHLRASHVEVNNVLLALDDRQQRAYDWITRCLPQSFRQMITLVFANDSSCGEAQDPARVILDRGAGWFPPEQATGDPSASWQWTGREARISFDNPKRNSTFYLQIAGRRAASQVQQQVAIDIGDETLDRFLIPMDDAAIHKVPIGAEILGSGQRVELRIQVDRTFIPSDSEETDDARELGVRVCRAAMAAH